MTVQSGWFRMLMTQMDLKVGDFRLDSFFFSSLSWHSVVFRLDIFIS